MWKGERWMCSAICFIRDRGLHSKGLKDSKEEQGYNHPSLPTFSLLVLAILSVFHRISSFQTLKLARVPRSSYSPRIPNQS